MVQLGVGGPDHLMAGLADADAEIDVIEGYGQIDLSTSYQITSHISVNASVSNLTESAFRLVDKYGITRLYDLSGRRFSAGIRASF